MSLGPLRTLAHIRNFLEREILPNAPSEQRGELRACLKILDELGLELNEAQSLLMSEAVTLHALCLRALAISDDAFDRDISASVEKLGLALLGSPSTLQEVQTLRDEGAEIMSACIRGLQALNTQPHFRDQAREILMSCYAELGRQAEKRAKWQSVF